MRGHHDKAWKKKNYHNSYFVFPIWKLHNPYCHNTYRRLTRIHKYWIAQMNTIPYVRCKWLNRCNNIWQGGKRPFPGTWRPFDQRFWFLNLHNHFCLWMSTLKNRNGILLPKLFWPTVKKKCSSDREKLLKFEAEGREFSKILRSLEQFIQTVKGQNNFAFLTFPACF